MRRSERTRTRSSSWLNGFGMKSSAPASIALFFSAPTLDVTMITGSIAVSSSARSCRQTVYPSMSGITTSRRMRSGFSDLAASSAEAPFVAEMTSYARAARTASSRRTFSGTSSTTRIRASYSLTVSFSAVLLHRLDEPNDVDGLRDVGVEAGVEEPFTISVHGLRGQRHDRNRRRPCVCAQAGEGFDTVYVGQLDVHQHEIRLVFGRQLHRPLAGRRLEQAEAGCLEDVAEELHVLLVVLDDEDLRACHVEPAFDGSVKTKALPSPSSLSTQIRPPCNSTSRFESASPRPVPSRCPAPASVCWNSSKIRS